MNARVHVRIVTWAAVGLILLGAALAVLPLAEPSPDPVRIVGVSVRTDGATIDLRVLRRGRLAVEVRTLGGGLVRVLAPEAAVAPGDARVEWDGPLPSGTYVVRATAYPGLRPYVAEHPLVVGA